MKLKNINAVAFYKAVRVGTEMIESISLSNAKFKNSTSLDQFDDVGLLVKYKNGAISTCCVVPFANIAYFAGEEEGKQEKQKKLTSDEQR